MHQVLRCGGEWLRRDLERIEATAAHADPDEGNGTSHA